MSKRLIYFLLFILFFVSNDTITFGTSGYFYLTLFNQILYVILLLYLFFFVSNLSGKYESIFLIIYILVFNIGFIAVLNTDLSFGYLVQINSLILGFTIVCKVAFDDFVIAFNDVLFYISLIGLFCFTLFAVFPGLLYYFPHSKNTADVSYINLYFYSQAFTIDSGFLNRNASIFREPGVYMIYLNIGILFEVFIKSKPDKRYIFVFIIALLTTLSTGGFVASVIILFAYSLRVRRGRQVLQLCALLLAISLLIWSNYDFFGGAFSKFSSSSREYSSYSSRLTSITIPLSIFMEHPFGVGLYRFSILYPIHSVSVSGLHFEAGGHSTNTFLNSLATYGILCFAVYFLSFYFLSRRISNSIFVSFFIFIAFVSLLSNQDIRYSLLFSTLLFYGVSAFSK